MINEKATLIKVAFFILSKAIREFGHSTIASF